MSIYISQALKNQIRERFKGRCAYCQTPESLVVAIFEYEHIVPVSAGGSSQYENICYSCPTCNRYKGIRTTYFAPDAEDIVPLYHPHLDSWPEHFRWSDDASELIGLTPTGRATILLLRMNREQVTRVRRLWVKLGKHPPE